MASLSYALLLPIMAMDWLALVLTQSTANIETDIGVGALAFVLVRPPRRNQVR